MPGIFSPGAQGAVAVLTTISLAVSAERSSPEHTLLGTAQEIGSGTVQSFVKVAGNGAPLAIGVTLSSGALERLPATPNTTSRCFDMDGNGRYNGHECMGDEERILDVPTGASSLPFSWVMLNWNPAGHHGTPYTQAHFDFHFYMSDRSLVESIRAGRCGEMVDCGDFKRGSQPVPAQYLPAGYIDIGAVAPRMGNHLLDSRSPDDHAGRSSQPGKPVPGDPPAQSVPESRLLSDAVLREAGREGSAYGVAGRLPAR